MPSSTDDSHAGGLSRLGIRRALAAAALLLGAASLAFGAFLSSVSNSVFDPVAFGDRAAASLADPRVAAFAADRITAAVLDQSPDLTAVRPLILATADGLASSEPFRALVRTAARSGHRTVFSEGTRRVVLSVPDVGVLLSSAFERASPQLAAKIPDGLQTVLASLDWGGAAQVVVDLWALREELRGLEWLLLAAGSLLLVLGGWLSADRRRGFVAAGVALLGAGIVVAALLPLGSWTVAALVEEPLERDAAVGLWRAFMSGLTSWGFFLAGLGVLFAAAGTSLLEAFNPLEWVQGVARVVANRPRSKRARIVWGAGWLAAGALAVRAPLPVLAALVVATGIVAGFLGARELFRIVLESVDATPVLVRASESRRSLLRTAVTAVLVLALAAVWALLRNPSEAPAPTSVAACNGHASLCDRRVDEVAFPGAHNAMSNAEIPDWMFPHHRRNIPHQLRDGVRALLIDVHYGFPGGVRIKTDLGGDRPTKQALERGLGPEGLEAALRIRDTLVGVDEGRHDLYLCHGFCELGAYELVPTLREIRGFLLQHPGEVLIIVVEDYVSPEDLAKAFEESRLAELVYRGPPGPPWPTLRQLVTSGQQVVVFIESGHPGVPWLRPAFELIQETPYTFHSPEEFSCRPNRGVPDGSLFQINHWIETTPAPRPTNAQEVNAHDRLLGRARQCQRERGLLPNVLAVDFYGIGDLLRVVDELNGMATE